MAGLGIYHYQARFYSPNLGRFLSADTIVPSYANPQSLNRMSYVVNNPLKYTDPTGHDYCDYIDSLNQDDCGGGLAAISSSLHNGNEGHYRDVPGQCEYSRCADERERERSLPTFEDILNWEAWLIKHTLSFIDYFSDYEDIIYSLKPIYKQYIYAFGTGGLEAIMDGVIYGIQDRWITSLTPNQRVARIFVVFGESLAIEGVSQVVGIGGMLVGGKMGEVAAQYISSAAISEYIVPTTTYNVFDWLDLGVPITNRW